MSWPGTPSGDQAFSPDIPTASTALTARDLARETGQRVEVLDQRTTTSSLYALPDGSWEVAQSGAPEWAQTSGDGTHAADWENVDPRLAENGDGSYSPNAHPQVVVVNGGNGEIFRMSDPETGLAVFLALGGGTVATPLVDGTRATFTDVARDTDLVLEIRPAGYEYFLVLKTPAAARASADIPLVFTMTGATMAPDGAGGFALVSESGEVIGSMPPPVAWDANSDLKRGSPVLDEWSPVQEFAPVTRALEDLAPADRLSRIQDFLASGADLQAETIVEVSQALAPTDKPDTFDVELGVPDEWIDDPNTQYPLVLDPSGGVGAAFDTFVQGGYTSDQSGATELKLGTYDSGAHKARSFLSFEWKDYQYTAVSSATLNLWEWHSWSCSATGWSVYVANAANTSTRWTSQPAIGSIQSTSTATKGFSSSCDDGWVSVGFTGTAQFWTGYAPATYHSLALLGASETNNYYWKRFNSNEAGWGQPYISLEYTSTPPLAPTEITVGNTTLTAAHRTDFTIKRPVFSATVTDKEGAPGYPRSLHAVFVLYKDGVEVGAYDGSTVASGGTSTYTPTFDLVEGANYTLYVATVFNGTTVSTGIQGGGTFTTTSQVPTRPCGLRVNAVDVGTANYAVGDGETVAGPALTLCDVREVIEPGDLDGDGNADLMVQSTDGTLRAYMGDGAGGVTSQGGARVMVRPASGSLEEGPWTSFTRVLAPGDLDNDGKVDLFGRTASNQMVLFKGLGDGSFAPGTAAGPGWADYRDVITPGDYDRDGNRDFIGMFFHDGDFLLVYRGDGTGDYPDPYTHVASGFSIYDTMLTPGNFDGDGNDRPDLIGWIKATGQLTFFAGPGAIAAPGPATVLGTSWGGFTQMAAPGDFTGNGTMDLIGLAPDGTLTVFEGDGVGGVATTGTPVFISPAPTAPAASVELDDSTPAFSAVVSDPDGGLVRAVFSLYRRRAGDTQWELVRNDLYGSWVTSGQRSYFRSTASSNDPGLEAALLAGNEYRVEVRSQDKSQSSASALTTGVLTVPPPGAAPDIPAGCDTFASPPSGSSTTC